MAKPISPVVPGLGLPVTAFAKNQPEYQELPAFRMLDGTVLSRWRLTWRERLLVLLRGDVYLWLMTFNRPLQPTQIQVERPSQTDLARSQAHARQSVAAISEARAPGHGSPGSLDKKLACGAMLAFIAATLLVLLSGPQSSRHYRANSRESPAHSRSVTFVAVESRGDAFAIAESRSSSHVFGDADSQFHKQEAER